MVLDPGLSAVGPVSSVVASSEAGLALVADRICTWVPVLDTATVTSPTSVGWGSCSIRPTPFLKLGNGGVSV